MKITSFKLRDVISPPPLVFPYDPISKIRQIMGIKRVDFVIIKNKPVKGIVEAYDICRSLLIEENVNNIDRMIASDLLSKKFTLLPEEIDVFSAIEHLLNENKIVVINTRNSVTGIFTGYEILNIVSKQVKNKSIPKNMINNTYVYAYTTHSLLSVLNKMIKEKRDYALIFDIQKRPVGFISYIDIISAANHLLMFRSYRDIGVSDTSKFMKKSTPLIQDIMRTSIYPVKRDASLETVVLRMYLDKVNTIPIVDNYGTVIGVIRLSDILKYVISR